MKPWTVGILGAGKIAQAFDRPGSDHVLSMAHAFHRSPEFEIGGFFDTDSARAEDAETRWSTPASPRSRSEWFARGWDVIYIATPDAQHVADLESAVAAGPKAILMEKPLSPDACDLQPLFHALRTQSIALAVNYPRRWHSGIQQAEETIQSGKLGKLHQITGMCSGGLMHNGCHMFDLFFHWFGFHSVRTDAKIPHGVSLTLEGAPYGPVPFTLLSSPSPCYQLWEFALYFEQGRIQIRQSPEFLVFQKPTPHPRYAGFHSLTESASFDLTAESLLEKTVSHLASLINHPALRSAWTEKEIAEHAFMLKMSSALQEEAF
jgi:predicted dehydrogenase